MYREGHLGLNALLYSPIAVASSASGHLDLALLGAVVALGTATLPDVDLSLPFVSHRGITHTVWFAACVGAAVGYLATFAPLSHAPALLFAFGFATGAGGILGHLAGDVVTPLGIRPLNPIWRGHYTMGLFKADNRLANTAFLVVGSVALVLSFVGRTGLL